MEFKHKFKIITTLQHDFCLNLGKVVSKFILEALVLTYTFFFFFLQFVQFVFKQHLFQFVQFLSS
jgi:hypothetical protein